MSEGKRYPLFTARKVAEEILKELSPHCENDRCQIVGSIRREKKEVGDIEILCIPLTTTHPDGLFDTKEIRIDKFINTINQWLKVRGCPADGKYTKRIHPSGILIDIFIANKQNWGLLKMIRTGSATYSKRIVTAIKSNGFKSEKGHLWKWCKGAGWKIEPTHTERCFYNKTGIPFVIPPDRTT